MIRTLFIFLLSTSNVFLLQGQNLIDEHRIPTGTYGASIDSRYFNAFDSLVSNVLDHHLYATANLGKPKQGEVFWFKIDFSDHEELIQSQDTVYLKTGLFEQANLYYYEGNTWKQLDLDYYRTGNYYKPYLYAMYMVRIPVSWLDTQQKVYISASYVRNFPNQQNRAFYFTTRSAINHYSQFVTLYSLENQMIAFVFLGIAAVLFFFNAILCYRMREKQFLYYGLFLLFQVIYYSRISPLIGQYLWMDNKYSYYILLSVSQVLINLSYLLFIKHFLDLPKKLPGFNKIVNVIAYSLLFFVCIDIVLLLMDPLSVLQTSLMNYQRFFMAFFAFSGVVYLLFSYSGKLVHFVAFATVIFTSGALLTLFTSDFKYMLIGSGIESFIFAIGLTYKIKKIYESKRNAEFEAVQNKLSALRAQINPHFLFNCLSSIQFLINANNKPAALKYLGKFSGFLRQVMESSIDLSVPLGKEIELLKVYMDLESLRFNHSFEYHIEVDDAVDVYNREVPVLITQPIVENAIKHGLIPKNDGDKMIQIFFSMEGEYIKCTVHDNGVGRVNAGKTNPDRAGNPSRGIYITTERLKLLNGYHSRNNLMEITDLVQGTQVTIYIPQ